LTSPELFGLIVSIQMLANIGLFLHNRHLAATVRDLSSAIERMQARADAEGPYASSGASPETADRVPGRSPESSPGGLFSSVFRQIAGPRRARAAAPPSEPSHLIGP
jgi:hypothetical protein